MKKFLISTVVAAGVASSVVCAIHHRKYIKGVLKRSFAKLSQHCKEQKVEKDVKKNKHKSEGAIKIN